MINANQYSPWIFEKTALHAPLWFVNDGLAIELKSLRAENNLIGLNIAAELANVETVITYMFVRSIEPTIGRQAFFEADAFFPNGQFKESPQVFKQIAELCKNYKAANIPKTLDVDPDDPETIEFLKGFGLKATPFCRGSRHAVALVRIDELSHYWDYEMEDLMNACFEYEPSAKQIAEVRPLASIIKPT